MKRSLDEAILTIANVVRDGVSVAKVDTEQTGNLAPFDQLFARAIERGLPMICANPDFVSPPKPGKSMTYQPGTLAAHYEALTGRVIYFGKPHKEHFDACVAGLGLPKERVAHIGDSMHHDDISVKHLLDPDIVPMTDKASATGISCYHYSHTVYLRL